MISKSRANFQGLLFHAVAVAAPLGIFAYFYHWQILIPTNATWLLSGDWGANVIGWNALRHDDWHWPLGFTRLLAWPNGVPITYTDSNPLLCLLLKPFSAILPTPFQFTGPWLLSCIVLQFAAAYALLRGDGRDRWLRLLGATLLTVVPTLINRMGHANLCAHWTILLSLYAFIHVQPEGRRDLWYGAILAISALVHPYLLLMNAAIWASDLMRRYIGLVRSRNLRGLFGLAARTAAVAAAPVVALWASGALGGYEGDGGGFGFYSMALDALFNPGFTGYSRFLPVKPQGDGQYFEGFQYLGVGLLAVVTLALATLATPAGRERLRRMRWLAWLAPALVVLFALALSDKIQFHGRVVGRVSYDWIPHLPQMFRGSGRLFWPCAYVLILVSLQLIFALPRRWALAIGLAALALQFADLTGFRTAVRGLTAQAAAGPRYPRTPNPRWEPLIASTDMVEFQPPDPHIDQQAFTEIAWRASSMGRPINIMYTARTNPAQKAFETAARSRFLRGELDPKHLYVISDKCIPAGLDASRLKQVSRLLVIPPLGARYPYVLRPAHVPDPFPLGVTVSLETQAREFHCVLGQDWSQPEGWGAWSDGGEPELIFRLNAPPERDLRLTLVARGYPSTGQILSVVVGGQRIARLALTAQPELFEVRVPKALTPGSLLDVTLKVDHPRSPQEAGESTDVRRLGVGLTSVRLDPAS